MDFRHVFRHAYSHVLGWGKMAPLVLNVQGTFEEFASQVDRFLAAAGGPREDPDLA